VKIGSEKDVEEDVGNTNMYNPKGTEEKKKKKKKTFS